MVSKQNSNAIRSVITQSATIRQLIDKCVRAAKSTATILITGESGTGKELFARIIHENSRRGGELVSVNCAALPSELIESELFGHEKGSFTDAISRRVGRFEAAADGTLLLDEITEIPLSTQAKLLRALETHEFQRVGSNDVISSNARVVATSNREIRNEVENGNFRLDLYHRLNVIEFRIPPLRERVQDIPLLAMHFVEQFKSENEGVVKGFTTESMQLICQYTWPGNIRELKNTIHRACVLTTQPMIEPSSIKPFETTMTADEDHGIPPEWSSMSLAEIERRVILASLQKFATKREAAEQLGVTSRTLANKLKIYGKAA